MTRPYPVPVAKLGPMYVGSVAPEAAWGVSGLTWAQVQHADLPAVSPRAAGPIQLVFSLLSRKGPGSPHVLITS